MTETKGIILIDSSSDSLTVSWPDTPAGAPYTLQYRRADDQDEASFQTLSDSLTTSQARKRNLRGESGFVFRAKSKDDTTWTTHTEPFYLLTQEEDIQRMEAPSVYLGGSHSSLRITWKNNGRTPAPDATTTTYELQMRESKPGVPWNTIANGLSGTQARKKSLTSKSGYQFRVRPVTTRVPNKMSSDHSSNTQAAFSPPSETMVALGLSPGIHKWFQNCGNLLRSNPSPRQPLATSTVADALGGKEFILLYASAHWCGPCRQFTPRLVQWYREQQQSEGLVEVVFLSADHDKDGFISYFQSMPWLAVDYDDDARDQLMAQIRVTGIPRLVVLDGRSGKIAVDNAVGQTLDVSHWRKLLGGS